MTGKLESIAGEFANISVNGTVDGISDAAAVSLVIKDGPSAAYNLKLKLAGAGRVAA